MYVWFAIFENYFMFSKTRRTKKICFFFVMKNTENTENTKFRKQEQFSKNIKMMFFMLSKIVFNNSF